MPDFSSVNDYCTMCRPHRRFIYPIFPTVILNPIFRTVILNDTTQSIDFPGRFRRADSSDPPAILPKGRWTFEYDSEEGHQEFEFTPNAIPDVYERYDRIVLTSDDLRIASVITIYETRQNVLEWRISSARGSAPRDNPKLQELATFNAMITDAHKKMTQILEFSENLENLSEQAKICRAQCTNLVRRYVEGIMKMKHTCFDPLMKNETNMWLLYNSLKLKQLLSSLDNLLSTLGYAKYLVQYCDEGRIRMGLSLSIPMKPPGKNAQYSMFSFLLDELIWNLDKIQYILLYLTGAAELKWNKTWCRYTLEPTRKSVAEVADVEMMEQAESAELILTDRDDSISRLQGQSFFSDSELASRKEKWWREISKSETSKVKVAGDSKASKVKVAGDSKTSKVKVAGDSKTSKVKVAGDSKTSKVKVAGDSKTSKVKVAGDSKTSKVKVAGDSKTSKVKVALLEKRWQEIVQSEEKIAAVVTKRLQEVSSYLPTDCCSIPGCFWINYQDLVFERRLSHGEGYKPGYKSIYIGKWLGQTVAIGIMEGYENLKEVIEKEALIMLKVQHPNIVDFLGCAFTDKAPDHRVGPNEECEVGCLVMEYMPEDLWNLRIRLAKAQDGLHPAVVVDILQQIVEAMIHMHKLGIIHRDLKAANCLVSPRQMSPANSCSESNSQVLCFYTVKVIDFGTSKVFDDAVGAKHTANQGTHRWMAPEVWGPPGPGKAEYTKKADVFSFAMTCYEVITGLMPFYEYSNKDLQEALNGGNRPSFPASVSCPEGLKLLLAKCWAKDPNDRPTFEEVRKDLWTIKYEIEFQ